MAHRGWEKKSLEVKVLRRFRQFALLNGEKKIRIQKIADKEVIDRVFHQLFFPEDPETLIEFMGLADDFVQKLPFFVLKCNISAEAVRVAYETLSKV